MGLSSGPPRLIFVGEVVIDIVMEIPALPPLGGDVLATASWVAAGGGFNVMVAAARQGLKVAYAGGHGTGPWGELARRALASSGIEILQEAAVDIDTGFDVALVDAGGERTFVTTLGAEAGWSAASLANLRVGDADLVYVSGYGLAYPGNGEVIADWLGRLAGSVGVLTDPGPLVADIPAAALARVQSRTDWWSCNQREARILTGLGDPSEAAAALLEVTGRAGVVVRSGEYGCVLAERGRQVLSIPAPKVDAVDTNGAGDAYAGIFLAGLAEGLDPRRAAERATVGAAMAVTLRGPATAPTRAEIDAYALHARY
jgi:sugar/nucleoside kinase (ribokinase family)